MRSVFCNLISEGFSCNIIKIRDHIYGIRKSQLICADTKTDLTFPPPRWQTLLIRNYNSFTSRTSDVLLTLQDLLIGVMRELQPRLLQLTCMRRLNLKMYMEVFRLSSRSTRFTTISLIAMLMPPVCFTGPSKSMRVLLSLLR